MMLFVDAVGPTASMIPFFQHLNVDKEDNTAGGLYIEDVVEFVSEVMFLVRVPSSYQIPSKENIKCRYGGMTHFAYRKALTVHSTTDGRAAVVCGAPSKNLTWDVNSATVEVDSDREIRRGRINPTYLEPLLWNFTKVVYEVMPTETDVVVFAHGINNTIGIELPEPERLKQFQCVYGGYYETPVIAQAQEIFRCPHPPRYMIPFLSGRKMTLRFEGKAISTVAYYNPPLSIQLPAIQPSSDATGRKLLSGTPKDLTLQMHELSSPNSHKPHHICSCTMIYNGAKFLKEWVYYHSHLGVEKFYLYDNNSEDNLDEVIDGLAGFNVTKTSWPWVKTQEAGFSHCSLVAEPECTWMLFTDIDEYLYPNQGLLNPQNAQNASGPAVNEAAAAPGIAIEGIDKTQPGHLRSVPSILTKLIEEAITLPAEKGEPEENVKVGQIGIFCQNYGPSGLTVSPTQGVTQGYTCRVKRTERHKALVLLGSVVDTLQNVIHHFTLKPGYRTNNVKPFMATVNHYKFQVWDEFKTKFQRRAATYVADWTEDRNHSSKDRVPDLGTKAVKPADWEVRYCELQDYGLRDYVRKVFGSSRNGTWHLPWE